jgi:drug/metabolite transporter (DMT)-like permease
MLLALGTSVLWGTSAFLAGLTARRVTAMAVAFYSQATSLVVLAAGVALWPADPRAEDVLWGAAAGVGTAVALVAFYRGLAVGRMSVVSPLAALISVGTPAMLDVVRGAPPTGPVVAGLAVALVAILLLSTGADPARAPTPDEEVLPVRGAGVGYAVVAGLGFSLFLIALDQAAPTAGLWPLVGTRVCSIPLIGAAALLVGGEGALARTRGEWRPLAAIGVLDVVGAALYFAATARAALTTVVVLASLYPVVTVLWARALLREPLGARRLTGVATSLSAIALILAG